MLFGSSKTKKLHGVDKLLLLYCFVLMCVVPYKILQIV